MRFSQENVHCGRTKSHQSSSPQGKKKPDCSLRFPKTARILKNHHFQAVHRERNRFYGDFLCVDIRLSKTPLLGISTPKKFGNAVERNYFKRLVREAFRNMQYQLPSLEMIVMPKKGSKALTLEQITQDLRKLCDS